MKIYEVTAIYFSATGTTKKSILEIANVLSGEYKEMDLTICQDPMKEALFGEHDVVIFGAPVYGGRIYEGAIKRFEKMKGHHTPCILVAAYGNRDFDDALIELYDVVKKQGFIPIAGAAVIGEHTYGRIQVGRPNKDDLEEDRRFAEVIKTQLIRGVWTEVEMPGNRPYREGGKGGSFKPTTNSKCMDCMLCAKNCPEQAISMENPRIVDEDKCIACFRCIRECKLGAKEVVTQSYQEFVKDFNVRLKERRENLYIINE